jgi:hypothetical protein
MSVFARHAPVMIENVPGFSDDAPVTCLAAAPSSPARLLPPIPPVFSICPLV